MAGVGIAAFIGGCYVLVECGRFLGISRERFHEEEAEEKKADDDSSPPTN
jgi:hypothetical protein